MAQSKLMNSPTVRQFLAASSAALTMMSSGCWTAWPSPSILNLLKGEAEVLLSDEEVSWMVSMLDIGTLVIPLPAGFMMDRFGRKTMIICAGVLSVISWLLTAVAYNAWCLYTARFLAGLANGISLTVLPSYLSEIASVSIRGALSTMFNLFIWIGMSFEFSVGPFVSFKILAILSVIPAVLLLLTLPFMPESPYYLSMRDRHADVSEALRWLRVSSGKSLEKDISDVKEWVDENRKNKRRYNELFSNSTNRRAMIITLSLMVFQKFNGGFCIVAYSSTTLPPSRGVFGPSEVMIMFSVVNVIANLLLTSLVDRWGRRPMLLFSAAGTALLRGFSAIYYYFDRRTSVDTQSFLWVPYACVVLAGVTQPGIGSIPFTLQGELLPIFLKSRATALCTLTSAITAFLVDKLYVTVDSHLGVYVNYVFFLVSGIICFVFITVFVFETRGKSFADIQLVLREIMAKGSSSLITIR